jgi:hypothetical protein
VKRSHGRRGAPPHQAKAFQEFFAGNLHAYVRPRALVEFVSGEPLGFRPGSADEYSNTDNIVVGLIAAGVSAPPTARCSASGCSIRSLCRGRPCRRGSGCRVPMCTATSSRRPTLRPTSAPCSACRAPGPRAGSSPPRRTSTASSAATSGARCSTAQPSASSFASSRAPPSPRPGSQLRRPRRLPVPDRLRNRLRPHRQLAGIHTVRGGDAGRPALGHGLGKRPGGAEGRQCAGSGRLQGPALGRRTSPSTPRSRLVSASRRFAASAAGGLFATVPAGIRHRSVGHHGVAEGGAGGGGC